MGVVYQARHVKLNRIVALKMILSGGHAGATDLARFRTEAEAIARLQHPNIVQIYDIAEHEGRPFFSLEFCGGGSLERRLAETGLSPEDGARLVETLASAVDAAHRQHVLHRDLKPANVLLTTSGQPKLTDFGLAKKLDEPGQTASGAVMGTPSYMAPEQAGGRAKELGPAVDVYALGAILYECLTGRPPFKAATTFDTLMQVLNDEPVPPGQLNSRVDPDLEAICLNCLAKDPQQRYASAAALAEDLTRFQAGDRPIHAGRLDEWALAVRWARKFWITAALTILTVSLMLLVYLVAAALSVAQNTAAFFPIVAAWVPGFLATMAILVRPRRWVVCVSMLFVVVAFGLPWASWAMLGGASGGALLPAAQQSPDAFTVFAISAVVGVIAAGVFGGISRGVARWYRCEMLTVFFGGQIGASLATTCCCCVSWLLFAMYTTQAPLGQRSPYVLSALGLAPSIGSLLGFCLGVFVVARFNSRRLKPG
jgi:hypothetical protein